MIAVGTSMMARRPSTRLLRGWRPLQLAPRLIEYVVGHKLVHLREDHTQTF